MWLLCGATSLMLRLRRMACLLVLDEEEDRLRVDEARQKVRDSQFLRSGCISSSIYAEISVHILYTVYQSSRRAPTRGV